MPTKLLGHRDLFGKRLSWEALGESLAPYHHEEVVIVLTSLAALVAQRGAEERDVQRLMATAFFLESADRVEKKIRAGCVVFHRPQILVAIRLAAQRCRGDAGSQPMGTAFFEGIARALVGITDHLGPPSPEPETDDKAPAHDRLASHLNHLLQEHALEAVDLPAACLRAHRILFERSPKLTRHRAFVNLPGAFHERHGIQCERWFAAGIHLLAKGLTYSLATMHENPPVVRIAADFRESPLESRQAERLFAPVGARPRRNSNVPLEPKGGERRDPLLDFEALRWRPVLHLFEDTYAAVDPQFLCDAIAGDLGSRLVACASDRNRARHWWTSLVRDQAERLLVPLTTALRSADRIHRDEAGRPRPIADWFHVRGKDAVLLWTLTAPVKRDFGTDQDMLNANSRLLRGLIDVARQATTTIRAWRAGLCDLSGRKWGEVKRIFPIALLERDLPQDAELRRLMAKVCREADLLGDPKAQPLLTIDLPTLEILAGQGNPPWLVPLIAQWSESPQRNQPFAQFLAKQKLPSSLPPEETRAQFDKLVKSMRKLLGIL